MSDTDDVSSVGDAQSGDETDEEVPDQSGQKGNELAEQQVIDGEDDEDDEDDEGEDDEDGDGENSGDPEARLLRDMRVDQRTDAAPIEDVDGAESDLAVSDAESDYESSDDEDENFARLTDLLRKRTIEEHHPTLIGGTDEFTLASTCIKRDEAGNISDPAHKTLPLLSKYERTRVIGVRASQIADGSAPFIDVGSRTDPFEIATLELENRAVPFIIKRPLPNGSAEYWKLNDLLA